MTGVVSPQVDIGALSIRGLSAFAPLLQALSADNVAPTAVIQMHSLGGSFLISGKHAAKVPDLLQRCSSIPFGRLAVSVGWRKGDTASTLAASAGGQAVALLSLCLFNLYRDSDAGNILFGLSQTVLAASDAISSVTQLGNVAILLKAKLETLGFGNLLAEQVVRLHDVYKQLALDVPDDLLEPIAAESMIDLLGNVSTALRDETKLVRITGTTGLGHVLGLVMTMFPQDTLMTVNETVIFEGLRKSIVIDFGTHSAIGRVPQFGLETRLREATQTLRSIKIDVNPQMIPLAYSFVWKNWVKDYVQLAFLAFGLTCSMDLLTACCEILILIPQYMTSTLFHEDRTPLAMGRILDPAKPYQFREMHDCCQVVLGAVPTRSPHDLQTAFWNLAAEASKALASVACSCGKCSVGFSDGWVLSPRSKAVKSCRKHRLWNTIGMSLDYTFWCFFVNPGPNTTVRGPRGESNEVLSVIHRELNLQTRTTIFSCETVHRRLRNLFSGSSSSGLASSSGANTIFPTLLRDLRLHLEQHRVYELVEGQLVFNGQYYNSLSGYETSTRTRAGKNLSAPTSKISPTNLGEHSSLVTTVRDCFGYLELRATARVLGLEVSLNLERIIIASLGIRETDPCEHPMNTPLLPDWENIVTTTSVASPCTSKNKIAIAQTRDNPTAQLLCCEPGMLAMRVEDCCLNCALDQIQQRHSTFEGNPLKRIIIV